MAKKQKKLTRRERKKLKEDAYNEELKKHMEKKFYEYFGNDDMRNLQKWEAENNIAAILKYNLDWVKQKEEMKKKREEELKNAN